MAHIRIFYKFRSFAIFLAFLLQPATLVYAEKQHDSVCSEERFQLNLPVITIAKDVVIESQEIEIEKLRQDRSSLVASLETLPVIVSVEQEHTNAAPISRPFSRSYSETTNLSATYDLNLLSKENTSKKIRNRIETVSLDIESKKTKHLLAKLLAANEIFESVILNDIFQRRVDLANRKLRYFEALKVMGDTRLDDISKAKSEILEIEDKILANTIKQNKNLTFLSLDISPFQINIQDALRPIKNNDINCRYNPIGLDQIKLEIDTLETELESLSTLNSMQVSARVVASQTTNTSLYSNDVEFGITFALPIYSGGAKKTERRKISALIEVEKRRMRDLIKQNNEAIANQRDNEKVIFASVRSLEVKVRDLYNVIKELKKRFSMGESVYLDLSAKEREYLETVEALLRLKYDLFAGWYEFLGRVNGFAKS